MKFFVRVKCFYSHYIEKNENIPGDAKKCSDSKVFFLGGAIRVGVDCNKKHSKLNYNTDRLIVTKELVGILNQVTISKGGGC